MSYHCQLLLVTNAYFLKLNDILVFNRHSQFFFTLFTFASLFFLLSPVKNQMSSAYKLKCAIGLGSKVNLTSHGPSTPV